jgi:hypothetical protein
MAEEKTLRLQMIGALILLGRFLMESVQAAGLCMWGVRLPVADDPGAALPRPSLTAAEQLTWSGLQWRLGRQKPTPQGEKI